MATMASIQTIGDFKQKISVALKDVLAVSTDVCGRTGEEACRHAIIRMAISAKAITKKAKKNRPVYDNPKFRHLLGRGQYKAAQARGENMAHYYKFAADKLQQPPKSLRIIYGNTKKSIARIKNVGLAKRSWMWGLGKLGGHEEGKPIIGTSRVFSLLSEKACGYIKWNRLSYILRILPGGWESTVENNVGKIIMAQAAQKLGKDWKRQTEHLTKMQVKSLQSYFLKAVA